MLQMFLKHIQSLLVCMYEILQSDRQSHRKAPPITVIRSLASDRRAVSVSVASMKNN